MLKSNNFDLIERNETNKDSKGGTELLQERLYDGSVPRELLEQFQITFSRSRGLDQTKFRIFYAHDLPGDPESAILAKGGWSKFHKIVFVSNWQMQSYIQHYGIPWSHCEVIENSIYPIVASEKQTDKIRFCYTSTPHRGLNILVAAFNELTKEHENVELDVFSSFKLYGWDKKDEEYQAIFDAIKEHPQMNYHGTETNEDIRTYLANEGHIFVHPGTWPETSCLCLIEAMSAELMCIHSNYAGLADTAAGFTHMYQFDETENKHAGKLFHLMKHALEHYDKDYTSNRIKLAKIYADNRFNWNMRSQQWTGLLSQIVSNNPSKEIENLYVYEG